MVAAINVPWTPGREVSYESALEQEIRLLREVVYAVTSTFDDEVPWLYCSSSLLTEDQAEAVARALGLDNGSSDA